MTRSYSHHHIRNGYGCLAALDGDMPAVREEGQVHTCACGRIWTVAKLDGGFLVWKHDEQPKPCGFCVAIAAGSYTHENKHAVAMPPRSGGAIPGGGHYLIVPRLHFERFDTNPGLTAITMMYAATIAPTLYRDYNIIVNVGEAAGMTAEHLHVHVLERKLGDGVTMPWPDRRPQPDRYTDYVQTMTEAGIRP